MQYNPFFFSRSRNIASLCQSTGRPSSNNEKAWFLTKQQLRKVINLYVHRASFTSSPFTYFCRVVSTLKRWRILRSLLRAIFVSKICRAYVTSKTGCHYSKDLYFETCIFGYSLGYWQFWNPAKRWLLLQERRRDGLLVYVGGSKEVIQRQ